MAFAYTITKKTVFGDRNVVYGTYTSTGGTAGGDVVTGLKSVEIFLPQPQGSVVDAAAVVVNESLPMAGGTVTIVTEADQVGNWFAIGL